MEAKDYQEIINTADCNAEVNFVDSDGELKIMGWAKSLIEISFKAGIKEVVDYFSRHWMGQTKGMLLYEIPTGDRGLLEDGIIPKTPDLSRVVKDAQGMEHTGGLNEREDSRIICNSLSEGNTHRTNILP